MNEPFPTEASLPPLTTKGDDFTCGLCGETFEAAREYAECVAEMEQYFGEVPPAEMAVVCDACWQKINPDAIARKKAAGVYPAVP